MNLNTLDTKSPHNSAASQGGLQRTMAFEIETGGHHASYIRNFAQQWAGTLAPHQIHFVVTPDFFQKHADVVQLIASFKTDAVQIHAITPAENDRLKGRVNRIFNGWKLFCKYATQLKVDRGLLMYSDHFQIPMLVGQASPCPVSCIYFRPTFHYGDLENYRPNLKQRLAAWRKRTLVKRLLNLKQMDVLFSLDSLAVDYMKNNFGSRASVQQLPDSFVRYQTTADQIAELHSHLNIEQGRKVCLLLGILDSRKGPLQLLDAAQRLPQSRQRELCLLLVGSLHADIEEQVLQEVERLGQETSIQIVLKNEYVSDTLVQRYYELADVALTTYQRHMGMSSALIRAALAGIPVLSSDYGLMGELVKRERLGITVDTEDSASFSAGLASAIGQPGQQLFDASNASAFASSHSPTALAQTLRAWTVR
jgi:glycosyltransferase involved in cell wall biosynthesis